MSIETSLLESFVEALDNKNINYRYTSGNKELLLRCNFCLDSLNLSHAHLFINIDEKSDKYLQFYCQKCNKKGIINDEFIKLYKLDIDSKNLNNYIKKKKRKFINKSNKKIVKDLKIPISKDDLDLDKIDYFQNRMGFRLTEDIIKKFKIITNIYEFLEINKINQLDNISNKMLNLLDRYFIGFLSIDNSHLILRNISTYKVQNFRYYDLELPFYKNNEKKKFYSIKNNHFDYLSKIPNIIIAEGIFDIIGVYANIISDRTNINNLYNSINGSNYFNIILYYLRLGYLNFNLEIYSDSDYNIDRYYWLEERLKLHYNKINIYYNKIGKDFGVDKDKIKVIKKMSFKNKIS